MIGYLMLGTNDLERSTAFYDQLLEKLGATRVRTNNRHRVWSFGEGRPLFCITRPIDDRPATVGNGVMVALNAGSPEHIDALHRQALSLGASNEGDPGFRSPDFYAAFFRDLDGNKLNFYCYI